MPAMFASDPFIQLREKKRSTYDKLTMTHRGGKNIAVHGIQFRSVSSP